MNDDANEMHTSLILDTIRFRFLSTLYLYCGYPIVAVVCSRPLFPLVDIGVVPTIVCDDCDNMKIPLAVFLVTVYLPYNPYPMAMMRYAKWAHVAAR